MNTSQYCSARKSAVINTPATRARTTWLAAPSLLLVLALTACGSGQAASSVVAAGLSSTEQPTSTPSATDLALTPCDVETEQQPQSADTYICTKDATGQLVWLEASASKEITDKRAADAAAKAAAAKAAADKAARLAAEKAAAEKAAQEAAAAQAVKEQAAEAKAAQDAAAAQAAAEKAAAQAAQQAVVPPAAPAPSNCDPNYAGACVPIASDVDCAGGSGNGPAYVQGPVTVVGTDIYRLDGNHDGYGCEG